MRSPKKSQFTQLSHRFAIVNYDAITSFSIFYKLNFGIHLIKNYPKISAAIFIVVGWLVNSQIISEWFQAATFSLVYIRSKSAFRIIVQIHQRE